MQEASSQLESDYQRLNDFKSNLLKKYHLDQQSCEEVISSVIDIARYYRKPLDAKGLFAILSRSIKRQFKESVPLADTRKQILEDIVNYILSMGSKPGDQRASSDFTKSGNLQELHSDRQPEITPLTINEINNILSDLSQMLNALELDSFSRQIVEIATTVQTLRTAMEVSLSQLSQQELETLNTQINKVKSIVDKFRGDNNSQLGNTEDAQLYVGAVSPLYQLIATIEYRLDTLKLARNRRDLEDHIKFGSSET